MTTFERNDRAVLVVLDRVDEVLLREENGRVQSRDDAFGDRDAEDLGRQARQRQQAALGEVVADERRSESGSCWGSDLEMRLCARSRVKRAACD